jgi:hypothetical protein
MPATLNNTGVLFNDSTQQNTAFVGSRGTAYTSAGSATFTIPTGVTALKITVVGGGGGSTYFACCTTQPGGAGGTSSVSSGTQTISTISATGGAGHSSATGNYLGGAGSGGTLNAYGGSGQVRTGTNSYTITGGASIFSYANTAVSGVLGASGGAGGGGGCAISFLTGLTPGGTLSVTVGAGGYSLNYPGGAGVVLIEW